MEFEEQETAEAQFAKAMDRLMPLLHNFHNQGEGWQLPAVPTTIVDVTGAGNAYSGGFTVALGEGLDPLEAGLRAVVSASFALEQLGIPEWGPEMPTEANRRLEWARGQVKEIST